MPTIPLYKLIDKKTNKPTEPKPREKWKKPTPLKDRRLNQKQQNLVEVMLLNTMAKKPKTNKQMANEVGYATSSPLKHPAVLEQMKPVLEQMKDLRQRALTAIQKKNLDAVDYKELIDSTDKLTKNIQLLSGEATDNSKMVFTWGAPEAQSESLKVVPLGTTLITSNANDSNTLPTTQVGTAASQLTSTLEGVYSAPTRGENSSVTESSAAWRLIYSKFTFRFYITYL